MAAAQAAYTPFPGCRSQPCTPHPASAPSQAGLEPLSPIAPSPQSPPHLQRQTIKIKLRISSKLKGRAAGFGGGGIQLGLRPGRVWGVQGGTLEGRVAHAAPTWEGVLAPGAEIRRWGPTPRCGQRRSPDLGATKKTRGILK